MTRGMRNNNPANIRRSATKWAFLKPVQSDKQFCQFLKMEYGVRAFFILMRTYRYKYGLKKVEDIIKRFAPPSENDTNAYLDFLSSKLLERSLDLNTDSLYCLFAKYVFLYESEFRCNIDYLKLIMKEYNCFVINKSKECHEGFLF